MAGLPGVDININNDRLGQTNQTDDTISGLIVTGVTVAGVSNVTQGNAYQLFSLDDAVNIGITSGGTNDYAYQAIKQFYDQAGSGSELWIMLLASTVLMSTMCDLTESDYAVKLLEAASGRIRYLAVSQKAAATPTIANGVNEDVDAAVTKAQALAVSYSSKYKPLRVILDGKDFNGTVGDLKDYKTTSNFRVSILLAGTGGKNAAIGLVIGRLASNPVQRSIARVKDGDLGIDTAKFTNDEDIITLENAWNAIHDKGYIFLRTIPGRSGYYFTDDPTLAADDNDLNAIKRVAVIDKATLLALGVATDYINDELPLSEDGTLSPAVIGNIKADIEQEINTVMTANGEISGCKVTIPLDQNILSTSTLNVTLDILPVAYAKYIKIDLGFTTSLEN